MELAEILKAEVTEALGSDNKWYCSKQFGREITNPDTLLTHYIRNGGPEHFRRRLKCCNNPQSRTPVTH